MANEGISDIFLEIADLLDLEGVKFKPEAYRRAARALQQLTDDVKELVQRGEIDEVPGIGEALAEKVREYVRTGEVPYLTKLRAKWPPGLLELMRLEGVGPKTTRRFFLEFQVTGPQDLERLLREGKLQGVAGFGDRKIELLQKALTKAHASPAPKGAAARTPLPEAQARADELLRELRATGAPLDKLVFAGSLRRRRETVGDLDVLATSDRPTEVMDRFAHLEAVEEVRLSGPTKTTAVLRGGLQVDLRVVPPEAFGAALQYFTGSKDHNIRLRALANKLGFSINEYGLTREEKLVPAPTEEEVYAAVGLPWIPPELREDQGEIEAASQGRLPAVVEDRHLRGDLHLHVPASIEEDDLLPWVEAIRLQGMSYGGFVVRDRDVEALGGRLSEVRASIPRQVQGIRVFLGVETTLGTEGWPKAVEGADYLVARLPERQPTELRTWLASLQDSRPPLPTLLTHLDSDAVERLGLRWKDLLPDPSLPAAVELAVAHDAVVSDTARARDAATAGVPVVLSGLPRSPEELSRITLAAGIARRGWIRREAVVNVREDPWSSTSSVPSGSSAAPPSTVRDRPGPGQERSTRRGK